MNIVLKNTMIQVVSEVSADHHGENLKFCKQNQDNKTCVPRKYSYSVLYGVNELRTAVGFHIILGFH